MSNRVFRRSNRSQSVQFAVDICHLDYQQSLSYLGPIRLFRVSCGRLNEPQDINQMNLLASDIYQFTQSTHMLTDKTPDFSLNSVVLFD